ncbi:MAG: sterol desaturase family protein [Methylococcaceae bacterium]
MAIHSTTLSTLLESSFSWPVLSVNDIATLSLLLVFSTLFTLEANHPYQEWQMPEWQKSLRTNSYLFLFNSLVISALSALSIFVLADNYSESGLLSAVNNPLLKLMLAVIAFDLIIYGWHRACHYYDGLWLFHKVHHSDPYLNVTTAFRVHIIELVLTTFVKGISIVLLGLDKLTVLGVEAISASFVMLHHTNISFRGEKWLGKLFIVPYLHRVHHSTARNEHDQNLGAVLSVWDRLFGTFKTLEPKAIGILNNAPLDFFSQLKFGFTLGRYKPAEHSASPEFTWPIRHMIAEAAYYKSQQRGFSTDNELNDWLEAEHEILQQINGNQKANQRPFTHVYDPCCSLS